MLNCILSIALNLTDSSRIERFLITCRVDTGRPVGIDLQTVPK